MGRLILHRSGPTLEVLGAGDGGVLLRMQADGMGSSESRVPRDAVRAWLDDPDGAVPVLPEDLPLVEALSRAIARPFELGPPDERGDRHDPMVRVVLEVPERRLAGLPWESAILRRLEGAGLGIGPVVRASPVPLRATSVPLTLPLRFVQVPGPDPWSLEASIQRVFGGHAPEDWSGVVRVHEGLLEEIPSLVRDWPSLTGLHLGRLPGPEESTGLLSAAAAEVPGTLGWLLRILHGRQTRLLVVTPGSPRQARMARELAAEVVARGGPAVLVGEASAPGGPLYDRFYDQLVHDMPLDAAFHDGLYGAADPGSTSLFVGGGREEALRVSSIGEGLLHLRRRLAVEPPGGVDVEVAELEAMVDRRVRAEDPRDVGVVLRGPELPEEERLPGLVEPPERTARIRITEELEGLEADWAEWEFQFHEREGLIPFSHRLFSVREAARVTGPTDVERVWDHRTRSRTTRYRDPRTGQEFRWTTPPPRRVLNTGFWEPREDAEPRRLRQDDARLIVGDRYHLGIDVGPPGVDRVVGPSGLIEEVFLIAPEADGVWLDVAVTGIDFEVLGAPVQALWLSADRSVPTERLFFAVVPRVAGIGRLRLTVYYRDNVIQSYRLAAVTRRRGVRGPGRATVPRRLAAALDLDEADVGGAHYLARLEYSLVATPQEIEERPARRLSVVANHLDGEPGITLKGGDLFGVRFNRDLPKRVAAVRKALHEVATPPIDGVDPEKRPYGFGLPGDPNAGSPEVLKRALTKLAEAGWRLYDAVVPVDGPPPGDDPGDGDGPGPDAGESSRERLERLLESPGQVIHVAHVLLEKVIPWAVMYDRPYDPDARLDDRGHPVAHDVCLAGDPPCGSHPGCLLHPDRVSAARAAGEPTPLPRTIVCPHRFWGFRHVIEIPPQQVRDPRSEPRSQKRCVLSDGTARLQAGFHSDLALADEHLKALSELSGRPGVSATWQPAAGQRDRLLHALRDVDLDVVYLYCHARGGLSEPDIDPPYLEVRDPADPEPGRITADALHHRDKWRHYPLVFLNGCGTVGFSPDALSPFVLKLVEDRGAAGVVGTEMPVWEPLAADVAVRFLEAFLAGAPAGETLLELRRELLARGNPLGLAYTLYGSAELRLDVDGDGRCPD